MGHKKKPESSSIVKTILNLVILLPTLYNLVGKIVALASYEARLAGKSLIKIIIIAIMSGILLASTWLCLSAIYGLYLVSLGLSYQVTLFVIVLVNLLILCIFAILIMYTEKNLSFRATRHHLRRALRKHDEESFDK
jgi:hypothetical protein